MRGKDIETAGGPNNSTKSSATQAEPIRVLDAIEAIRLRPHMYIGTDSQAGLIYLLDGFISTVLCAAAREIGSGVDKPLYGSMRNIEISFHAEHMVTITDDGPGLSPQPLGPGDTKSLAERVFTQLLVPMPPLAVTNALSQWLELKVWREGYQWEQNYRQGRPQSEIRKIGASEKHGNSIRFMPDPAFFADTEYDFDQVVQWFRERAPKLERKIEELNPMDQGWYGEALREQHSLFRNAYSTIRDKRPSASSTREERRVTFNG